MGDALWAMHYGALHPDQPSAIVLDSVLPSEVDVLTQELEQQAAVEDLLQRCIDDLGCAPALPYRSGEEFAAAVVDAIEQGECGGGDDGGWRDTLYRDDLGMLLNWNLRDYVPLVFDSANHAVVGYADMPVGDPCARSIMLDFAASPSAELETGCMDEHPRVDPALTRPDLLERAAQVFGTDDPWSLVP